MIKFTPLHPPPPKGAYATLGPAYLATFCAISVTLGALSYSLAAVLTEYYLLQQALRAAPPVRPSCVCHAVLLVCARVRISSSCAR